MARPPESRLFISVAEQNTETTCVECRWRLAGSAFQIFLALLASLSYLKSINHPRSDETIMRLLIVVVALVLISITLILFGRPDLLDELFLHWPY
jgi:Ca2+/Na+ antiporter